LEEKKEAAMWHNMIVGCIGRSIITESYGNFRGIKLVNIDPTDGIVFDIIIILCTIRILSKLYCKVVFCDLLKKAIVVTETPMMWVGLKKICFQDHTAQ
jgi:hypothetical protein